MYGVSDPVDIALVGYCNTSCVRTRWRASADMLVSGDGACCCCVFGGFEMKGETQAEGPIRHRGAQSIDLSSAVATQRSATRSASARVCVWPCPSVLATSIPLAHTHTLTDSTNRKAGAPVVIVVVMPAAAAATDVVAPNMPPAPQVSILELH